MSLTKEDFRDLERLFFACASHKMIQETVEVSQDEFGMVTIQGKDERGQLRVTMMSDKTYEELLALPLG